MLMVLMVWIVTTMESALASPMLLETNVTNVQQDTPTSPTATNVIPTIMAILIVNPVLAIPKGLKVRHVIKLLEYALAKKMCLETTVTSVQMDILDSLIVKVNSRRIRLFCHQKLYNGRNFVYYDCFSHPLYYG